MKDDLFSKKIDFLVQLQKKIGEQKIDILISRDKSRDIEKVALKEGILLDRKRLRVNKYLNQCNKHKIRIEKAYAKVIDIFPISAKKYEVLKDEEIEAIDQYLFRFSKLQDTVGERLFRLIVSDYSENIERLSFIDILNRLERINILEDVNQWRRLRDIRNNISHQYDDEPYEMSEALNNIFAQKDVLFDIFFKIKEYYNFEVNKSIER